MLRSAFAVAIGLVLIVLLIVGGDLAVVRLMPDAIDEFGRMTDVAALLILLTYVFVVDTFGCWVAARISDDRPMATALALGVLELTGLSISAIFLWEQAPAWYHLLTIAGVLPAAWLGGAAASQRSRSASLATA